MTEKEFDNLKEGDKVWIFLDKPKKTFVIAKQKDIGSGLLSVKVDDGGHHTTYVAEYVFLAKSEALEAEIKREEKIVENNERGIANAKERIARCKAELTKAKAEEGKQKDRFFVDFNDGVVREQANGIIPPRIEPHLCGLYSTETEAYAELAKYYYKKANEAVAKHADLVAKERGWK